MVLGLILTSNSYSSDTDGRWRGLVGCKWAPYKLNNGDIGGTVDLVIKNDWIASKCGWTPFDGYEVKGFPLGTIVNGKAIVWDGKLIEKANGKPLFFSCSPHFKI